MCNVCGLDWAGPGLSCSVLGGQEACRAQMEKSGLQITAWLDDKHKSLAYTYDAKCGRRAKRGLGRAKVQLGTAHRIISECQKESLERDSNMRPFNVAFSAFLYLGPILLMALAKTNEPPPPAASWWIGPGLLHLSSSPSSSSGLDASCGSCCPRAMQLLSRKSCNRLKLSQMRCTCRPTYCWYLLEFTYLSRFPQSRTQVGSRIFKAADLLTMEY